MKYSATATKEQIKTLEPKIYNKKSQKYKPFLLNLILIP